MRPIVRANRPLKGTDLPSTFKPRNFAKRLDLPSETSHRILSIKMQASSHNYLSVTAEKSSVLACISWHRCRIFLHPRFPSFPSVSGALTPKHYKFFETVYPTIEKPEQDGELRHCIFSNKLDFPVWSQANFVMQRLLLSASNEIFSEEDVDTP